MALVKCPECGKENVSDSAEACPVCGYPIKAYYEKIKIEENEKREKEKVDHELELKKEAQEEKRKATVSFFKEHKKKIVVGVASCSIAIIAIIGIHSYLELQTAIKAYDNGNYKEAYDYFANTNKIEYRDKALSGYINQLLDDGEIDSADKYYELVTNSEDKEILEPKMFFSHAMRAYKAGDFRNAINLFQKVQENTETEKYLDICRTMDNLQGEWILKGIYFDFFKNKQLNFAAMTFDGWNATLYYCKDFIDNFVYAGDCELTVNDDDTFEFVTPKLEYKLSSTSIELCAQIINDDYFYNLEKKDSNYMWYRNGKDTLRFKRGNIDAIKNDTSLQREPFVGMKKEALENSTWGKPRDINKSTYSWGTTEQWCYSNNRYVYLENDVVTSISE
jgi:hypothetical protein